MERFAKLAYVLVITVAFIGAGLWVYPFLDPMRPEMLARALILRGTLFVFGVMAFMVALVLIDIVTPGDWLERVGHEALSSAVLLSALVIGLAWMYCYS